MNDICAECGPGRCDGSTQSCTLESYYANTANGPRPRPAAPWIGHSEWLPPTVRSAPAPLKCECGSGSNERSGAHSHWCQLWVEA